MLIGLLLLLLVVVILVMVLRGLSSGARDAAKGINAATGQVNRLNGWLAKKQEEQRGRSAGTRAWVQESMAEREAMAAAGATKAEVKARAQEQMRDLKTRGKS